MISATCGNDKYTCKFAICTNDEEPALWYEIAVYDHVKHEAHGYALEEIEYTYAYVVQMYRDLCEQYKKKYGE